MFTLFLEEVNHCVATPWIVLSSLDLTNVSMFHPLSQAEQTAVFVYIAQELPVKPQHGHVSDPHSNILAQSFFMSNISWMMNRTHSRDISRVSATFLTKILQSSKICAVNGIHPYPHPFEVP